MTVTSYRARRRLTIGDGFREPGEPAPEAITWFRLDSYLHTGAIIEAVIEDDELRAWVAQYCPELTEQVIELHGLPEDVDLEGPHKTPRRRTRTRLPREVKTMTETPEVEPVAETAPVQEPAPVEETPAAEPAPDQPAEPEVIPEPVPVEGDVEVEKSPDEPAE